MPMRTQTMVQLNEELLELLDSRAARAGVSRSQLIREAIEEFVAADRAAATDRAIVDGYTKKPQGGEFDVDDWGDLNLQMPTLMADQMKSLAAEEHDAGHEPW